MTVLDLGTGTAQIPIELCRQDPRVRAVAIDLAEEMLKLARANVARAGLAAQIELERVDAKGLPFADGHFAAVISNSIVHHIPEPRGALAEAVRVVRSGGLVFVRDLSRPRDDAQVLELVSQYAAATNDHQRQLFDQSLRAALSLARFGPWLPSSVFPPTPCRPRATGIGPFWRESRIKEQTAMASVAEQLTRAADLQKSGQWNAAEQAYRAVLAIDPREVSAHFWLATALCHQGRLDEAVDSFGEAWRLAPKMDPLTGQLRNTLAANFVELGLAMERQGRLAPAGNSYQKALALVSDCVPALGNLGNVLKNQGRFDEAADCYRRVLAVAPNRRKHSTTWARSPACKGRAPRPNSFSAAPGDRSTVRRSPFEPGRVSDP